MRKLCHFRVAPKNGGRTEVYKKGEFKNVYYYDINSLYPSVMLKAFPLPQSVKIAPILSKHYILDYEGVTDCIIKAPNINKPFLPYRDEKKNKLIFPYGKFRGVWNNCELRKALELGYEIIEIKEQIIYTKTFYPFKDFVNYFYDKRLDFKKEKNPMEFVMKLILNSLYGKFGQKKVKEVKVLDMENFDGDYTDLEKQVGDEYYERDGKIINVIEKDYNGKNVYPILASYVTSYARLLMYDFIKDKDVLYTDTDSIFTTKPLKETSKELGEMKEEEGSPFKRAYFVKPKFYFLVDNKDNETTKIKGLSKANKEDFFNIIEGKEVNKLKFTKLKESIRRGMKPNTKIVIPKLLSLEDNKREWKKQKDILISFPLKINDARGKQ